MFRITLCLMLCLSASSISSAQNETSKQILARFDTIRPKAEDLAMYRLDWAESLDDALLRAAKENRPVFLVIIHAKYGDVTSGHC